MPTITPTRFDWTDDATYTSGINFTYPNLRDFFKSILVNGLGSKPALGWTIQFTESVDAIVFRNPSNTFSMRISEGSGTGSTYGDWPDVTFAVDFVDNNTPSNVFHSCAIPAHETLYPLCIAHADTFYLTFCDRIDSSCYTRSDGNMDWLTLYCGNYKSLDSDATPVFACGGIYSRVSQGGGIYTSEPAYLNSSSYRSPLIELSELTVNTPIASTGGVSIPFLKDGSTFIDQPSYLGLFTFGTAMTNLGRSMDDTDIESLNYLLQPIIRRDTPSGVGYISSDTFTGVLSGLFITYRLSYSATSKIFGDTFSIGGGLFIMSKSGGFYSMIRVDEWEI